MNKTIPIARYEAEMAEKNSQITALRHELDQLKKMIFGSKTERFIPAQHPEQLGLDFGEQPVSPTQVEEEPKQTITYQRRKKKHPGRTALPENIPTKDIIIEPGEDTTGMKLIGQEITETIDYKPGVLLKIRYIRPKYARPEEADQDQSSIIIGQLPDRPIPKGIPEGGLLAHLFVAKYIDHLPFYRQIEQFKRNHGWTIHKSTINDWFAACCTLLEPLYQALFESVMDTDYLQVDESPIKVLHNDKKPSADKRKAHQGYMWLYRNPINGLVLFDYRKGRGMHGPKERLEDFSGQLQCDGYKVYVSIANKRKDISLISCLAHIRRKFFDAQKHHPTLAQYGLKEIQKLYAIERTCTEAAYTTEQRQEKRDREARPVFDELLKWVNTEQLNNLSKGPIGTALFYASHQLPKLSAYLDDGRILIDNNLIENAVRPLAIGRKNYLFAGSHQGAKRAAMMYSFFASCKTLDVNPWEWLKCVLENIGTLPINKIESLLPQNLSKANEEA